jgi:hypothetical protein
MMSNLIFAAANNTTKAIKATSFAACSLQAILQLAA